MSTHIFLLVICSVLIQFEASLGQYSSRDTHGSSYNRYSGTEQYQYGGNRVSLQNQNDELGDGM